MKECQNHSKPSSDLPFRTSQRSGSSAFCEDCKKQHDPRRHVICVDGTLYDENGSRVDPWETSNVHRIWQLLPFETRVEDNNGQMWQQTRMDYVPGIGVRTGVRYTTASIVTAVTGRGGNTGCDAKIKEVYKECCSLCPSRDEIFLFGFSRGAFVVRAVAGMLHHLGSLRTDGRDFDSIFEEALKVWQDLRSSHSTNNKIEAFRSQYTRRSPAIRFMGVFDTVQAYNDSGLNDIRHLDNVYHVRHAMAMFERRRQFSLERFTDGTTRPDVGNRSCHEAWFFGTHGNLGGACREDGLALWPLQWILTEAQRFGLKLSFTATEGSSIKNPAHLVFPWLSSSSSATVPDVHNRMTHVSYTNGLSVPFYDLTNTFKVAGFKPHLDAGPKIWIGFEERQIFGADGSLVETAHSVNSSSGVFVHPSVYWMDNKRSDTIRCINISPFAKQLRDSVDTVQEQDRRHWNVAEEIAVIQKPEKPRILVCGEAGVGKSSLINAVLDMEATTVNEGPESTTHDINEPLGSSDKPLWLHDSQGWQSGETANFETIQRFLKKRRQAHLIRDQLHCVWFCCSSTQSRISQTDVEFLKLDFGQVPVLLITTKQDAMNDNVVSRIMTNLYRPYRTGNPLELPPDKQDEAKAHIQSELQRTMNNVKRDWLEQVNRYVPKENQLELTFEFFSLRSPWIFDSIPRLLSTSEDAITSDRIRRIHREAQKNWIDNALHKSIDVLVKYWGENRKTFNLMDSEGHVKRFATGAIDKIQQIFQYDGFSENHHPDHILNLLHYPAAERGILTLIFNGLKGVAGTIALLSGPVGRTLVAGTYGISAAQSARQNAISLIPELVHVLLIFERIYWYHGGKISDLFIEGSCYYYLKKQAEVIKRVDQVRGWDMFTAQVKRSWEERVVREILTIVVNEFRFKYSHHETEEIDPTDTLSMPGGFVGGGF